MSFYFKGKHTNFWKLQNEFQDCVHVVLNRVSNETKEQADFKIRYAWYLGQILVLIFFAWIYGALGSLFIKAPAEYQWLLAFVTPFAKEMFFKLLYKQTFSIGYCIGIRYIQNVSVSAHRYIFCNCIEKVSIQLKLPILFRYFFTHFLISFAEKYTIFFRSLTSYELFLVKHHNQ